MMKSQMTIPRTYCLEGYFNPDGFLLRSQKSIISIRLAVVAIHHVNATPAIESPDNIKIQEKDFTLQRYSSFPISP